MQTDSLPESHGQLLWSPSIEQIEGSRLHDYQRWLDARRGVSSASYEDLWRWSTEDLDGFWQNADFDTYMELYGRTACTLKRVDAQLRVGGPATAGFSDHPGVPPWGEKFLSVCAERKLPLDFFSTHPYPTRYPIDLEGRGYMVWDGPDRLLVDVRGCDKLLRGSAYPNAERHYTEWSSSPSPRDPVHDSAFMASFIVDNNWRARGLMDSLAFWALSDIFEECRIGDTPFHGGFGLINIQGLKKAS